MIIDVTLSPFNATGNGISDDTLAIQSALDAVSSKGDTVFFPSGTYRITKGLKLKSNTYVKGEGHSSYIKGNNTRVFENVIAADAVDNLIFDSVRLESNRDCIALFDCSSVIIRNCIINLLYNLRYSSSAINIQRISGSSLTNRRDFHILNNEITTPALGVLFQGKDNRYLENILLSGNIIEASDNQNFPESNKRGEAIKIDYFSKDIVISNNILKNTALSGITLEENVINASLSNNIIEVRNFLLQEGRHGIRLTIGQTAKSINDFTISNNIIFGGEYGIISENDLPTSIGFLINSNIIYGQSKDGIYGWFENSCISGNIIRSNDGLGIHIRGNNNVIAANKINNQQGIKLTTSHNTVIEGNNINGGGIIHSFRSSRVTINNNSVIDPNTTLGAILISTSGTESQDFTAIASNTVVKSLSSGNNYAIYIANYITNVFINPNILQYTVSKYFIDNPSNVVINE